MMPEALLAGFQALRPGTEMRRTANHGSERGGQQA
jgi:hypothetical protein